MSVYNELIEMARIDIENGTTCSADEIIEGSYEYVMEHDAYLWEVIEDIFSPLELLNMIPDRSVVDESIFGRIASKIGRDIESCIQDNTWEIYYCDGPEESDYYYWDTVHTKEEFDETIDNCVGNGYLLISIYDNEAYLEEVEEEDK